MALDALRGLLVVAMALNHVPTTLDDFTNHPLGFMSSAEGFVFLSGLIGGYVYVKKIWKKGVASAGACCWRRAGTIYAYHIAAFLIVFAWLGAFALAGDGLLPFNAPPLMAEHPGTALWSGLLLLYQPSLFDVLPIYFLMLLCLPGILVALERGYRAVVVGSSLGVWVLANYFMPQTPYSGEWVRLGVFNPAAWQLLFVAGAVFGHAWANGIKPVTLPRWLILGASAFALACFGLRHALIAPGPLASTLDWLTNKNNLAPLRLVNASILFYLTYLAVARWPRLFHWQPLAFLGRNALPVYTAHILVAYFINTFPNLFAENTAERWFSTILMVLSLFAVATLHSFITATRRKPHITTAARRPYPETLPSASIPAAFKSFSR